MTKIWEKVIPNKHKLAMFTETWEKSTKNLHKNNCNGIPPDTYEREHHTIATLADCKGAYELQTNQKFPILSKTTMKNHT